MKKFKFSLEKVLGYKKQLLEGLKNEMARLQMECRELEDKIAEIAREFSETNETLKIRLTEGLELRDLEIYKRYFSALNRKTNLLEAQKQEYLLAISAKQEEIVTMNSDISGLEKLRDKQLAEYLAQSRKEQELMIEEFVGRARCSAGS